MSVVVYTDEKGRKQVREVPAGVFAESEYAYGILLGPPDLDELGEQNEYSLAREEWEAVSDGLAEAMIYDYPSLRGRKNEVDQLLHDLYPEWDRAYRRIIVRAVLSIYQRNYYLDEKE